MAKIYIAIIRRLVITFFALFATTLAHPVATAQSICLERADIQAQLDARYGEQLVYQALTDAGLILEVYRTANGSTWTIVFLYPNGCSQIASHGEAWSATTQTVGEDS